MVTKTKKSKRRQKTQTAHEMLGHGQLGIDNQIDFPSEPISFENLTTKAECLLELGHLTDQLQALTEQTDKVRELGRQLGKYMEHNFGAADEFNSSPSDDRIDRRKIPNPEKNLKISVRRVFGWAKQHAKTAEEAKERAIEVITAKNKLEYDMLKVPSGVYNYVDHLYKHYDLIGTKAEIPAV